jgi:hypothetical protein
MAEVRSSYWNENTGVCEKHNLMVIPCLCCAAERDENVEVHFTDIDRDVAIMEGFPLSDLLPENFDWVTKVA